MCSLFSTLSILLSLWKFLLIYYNIIYSMFMKLWKCTGITFFICMYATFVNGLICHAGYMPSDLYNLNSEYGSEEELKHCIVEMHNQDLLVCMRTTNWCFCWKFVTYLFVWLINNLISITIWVFFFSYSTQMFFSC